MVSSKIQIREIENLSVTILGQPLVVSIHVRKTLQNINYVANYGVLLVNIPLKIYLSKLHYSEDLYRDVTTFLTDIFKKNNPLNTFRRRGIILNAEPFMTDSYVYIQGKKIEITNDFRHSEGKFYASTTSKAYLMYEELALGYFKKRIKELTNIMQYDVEFDVQLCHGYSYIGLNNSRGNIISLNPKLYSYYPDVSDSVLIHEIAHFKQRNHSANFYNIVLQYCPRYNIYSKIIPSGNFGMRVNDD